LFVNKGVLFYFKQELILKELKNLQLLTYQRHSTTILPIFIKAKVWEEKYLHYSTKRMICARNFFYPKAIINLRARPEI